MLQEKGKSRLVIESEGEAAEGKILGCRNNTVDIEGKVNAEQNDAQILLIN